MSADLDGQKFMFVFRDPKSGAEPTPDQLDRLMRWIDDLKARGHFLAGNPLAEDTACVLRGERGRVCVDGPFIEAKEVIGGYMLVTARDFARAAALARACPILAAGTSIEVRQVSPMDGRPHLT